jgi:polysaccharide pyruvyl transferase WcaK-like protein
MQRLEENLPLSLAKLPSLQRIRLSCPLSLSPAQATQLTNLVSEFISSRFFFEILLTLGPESVNLSRLILATAGLAALREVGFAPAARASLDPENAEIADDLLAWFIQNKIEDWGFDLFPNPSSFTPEQRFHLSLFLNRLARRRDIPLARRMHYTRLSAHLIAGGGDPTLRRPSLAPYQAILDNSGVLLPGPGVAAPPGWAPIPPASEPGDPLSSWSSTLPERTAPPTTVDLTRLAWRAVQNLEQQRRFKAIQRQPLIQRISPATLSNPADWRHVLITGWYGTETTGDKAILGEILHFLRQRAPACRITVTTIDRLISEQTRRELPDLDGSGIVEIAAASRPALIEQVDAVLIGGGPLMETTQMEYVWRIFQEANRQKKARIIFGCGVGPFHTPRIKTITANILQMATAGFLRDAESQDYAQRLAPGNPLGMACDPAFAYVARWAQANHPQHTPTTPPRIATLLRANTREFVRDHPVEDANAQAAARLAQFLQTAARQHKLHLDLLYTNAPWIGGDDRLFNRQVAAHLDPAMPIRLERAYLPTDAILSALAGAQAALAMRYHGHIFSMALGIPFLSINYTGSKGKVYSLVRRTAYEDWSLDWRAIDPAQAAEKMTLLLRERERWSAHLLTHSARLLVELNNTYQQVFNS